MNGPSQPRRLGIAPVVMAIVVVIVIAVAGVGTYVLVIAPPGVTGANTTTIQISVTTSTHSTSRVVSSTRSASSVTSSTRSTSGLPTYQGTFNYVTPLGPFGINDSSGKPVEWNSTQSASGSFTFSIDPSTYTGTGTGHGSITVATHGYCTGTMTVQYSFTITAIHVPGQNFFVSFNTPSPSSVEVPLSCQGSTVGFSTANNPITFLSVYPNEVSPASLPSTTTQTVTAGIGYTVSITQSG